MTDRLQRTIATDILIDAPIDDVWRSLTDYAGYSRWNPYLVRVEGAPVAGTQIVAHAVDAKGHETVLDVDVRLVTPYTMHWVGGLPDRAEFEGDHWFELRPVGSGTRLAHVEHFTGSRMPGILDAFAETITDNFERMNLALKRLCESPR
ncbi:MAG: SRPBCC domain-containing protein [Pseudomonadales bacterium]